MSCALNLVVVCRSDWGKLKHYWASLVAQTVKNPPAMPGSIPGLGRSPGEGDELPTPVLLFGEFHGQSSLADCKESDTTERLTHTPQNLILGFPVAQW